MAQTEYTIADLTRRKPQFRVQPKDLRHLSDSSKIDGRATL